MAERYRITSLEQVTGVDCYTEAQKAKKARDAKLGAEKQAALTEGAKQDELKLQQINERAKTYEKDYAAAEAALNQLRQDAKAKGGFYKEAEPKLIFAIRIKGINKVPPTPRKIMQLFRLRQIHSGAFVRSCKSTDIMMKKIAPYVTFGNASVDTVRKLVYKRGHARIGKMGSTQRLPLHDNRMVSDNLGKFGIHSIEDLVHEIATVGPHFTEANRFLWTFKLAPPKGGFISKRHGYTEARGGDLGNREDLINELVDRML